MGRAVHSLSAASSTLPVQQRLFPDREKARHVMLLEHATLHLLATIDEVVSKASLNILNKLEYVAPSGRKLET